MTVDLKKKQLFPRGKGFHETRAIEALKFRRQRRWCVKNKETVGVVEEGERQLGSKGRKASPGPHTN